MRYLSSSDPTPWAYVMYTTAWISISFLIDQTVGRFLRYSPIWSVEGSHNRSLMRRRVPAHIRHCKTISSRRRLTFPASNGAYDPADVLSRSVHAKDIYIIPVATPSPRSLHSCPPILTLHITISKTHLIRRYERVLGTWSANEREHEYRTDTSRSNSNPLL